MRLNINAVSAKLVPSEIRVNIGEKAQRMASKLSIRTPEEMNLFEKIEANWSPIEKLIIVVTNKAVNAVLKAVLP
ncbi:MAG: hypothetical protein COA78_29995 [Blastopirellula sp.]|nr:MAG: hypothetical protein COA78_29995 [Blastopirellula sp.]